MDKLGAEADRLNKIKLPDHRVMEYIEFLLPMPDEATKLQEKNVDYLRSDLKLLYLEAPDLEHVGKNGYRFICAVSDFAIHVKPLRETASYQENLYLFIRTMDGNSLIDKAYELTASS